MILWWRREPRFKKVVRPEEPLREVYCTVTEPEKMLHPSGKCKTRNNAKVLRLEEVWFVPDRASKIHWVGEDRFWAEGGGTFLLYPATLRPGACTGEKGDIGYTCEYPGIIEYDGEEWKPLEEGKYFRLRDDVVEVGGRRDRFGHPVYIVRNALGETFRLAGVYARIYHILRERDGWVSGADLQDEEVRLHRRLAERVKEAVDRMGQEELEELSLEYGNAGLDLSGRVSELLTKLDRGEVEELPSPERVPADIERVFATIESKEFFFEFYTLGELAERRKDKFGGDLREAFLHTRDWFTVQALGLLVYEALIIEMGVV